MLKDPIRVILGKTETDLLKWPGAPDPYFASPHNAFDF